MCSYSMFVQPPCYRSGTQKTRSFCQKCDWQVTPKHAHTLDPTKSDRADYADVRAWFGKFSRNELTRSLSGNIRPQSSQLAEPLWTDRARANVHLKKKKTRRGMHTRKRGKSHQQHHTQFCLTQPVELKNLRTA